MKYPNGGQEASRVTAAARRKLGSLGSALDNLRDMLDGPQCADACAPHLTNSAPLCCQRPTSCAVA